MRLGIALPTDDADQPAADGRRVLRAESLAEGARRIEAAGFESAWVFDSIGRGFLLPDPLVALSVAATVTSRIELGTGVLADSLSGTPWTSRTGSLTTHLASGGRLRLGVGSGLDGGGLRRARHGLSVALPPPRRGPVDDAEAVGGRARGRGAARHVARRRGRAADLHRLVGGLPLDRARRPRVRRLGGIRRSQ